MNYYKVLLEAEKNLKDVFIKNPRLDSEILLSNSLKIPRRKYFNKFK